MCRLNSTSANYKASKKKTTQHKTVPKHKNETLNRQNKRNIIMTATATTIIINS